MRSRFLVPRALRFAMILALLLAVNPTADGDPLADRGWVWPVQTVQLLRPFEAPAHRYAPGHRGIDLSAPESVRSPADGRIAFAGAVAGRLVVTIDHGDGLVTTLEPVATGLVAGDRVARGAVVGNRHPRRSHAAAHTALRRAAGRRVHQPAAAAGRRSPGGSAALLLTTGPGGAVPRRHLLTVERPGISRSGCRVLRPWSGRLPRRRGRCCPARAP